MFCGAVVIAVFVLGCVAMALRAATLARPGRAPSVGKPRDSGCRSPGMASASRRKLSLSCHDKDYVEPGRHRIGASGVLDRYSWELRGSHRQFAASVSTTTRAHCRSTVETTLIVPSVAGDRVVCPRRSPRSTHTVT